MDEILCTGTFKGSVVITDVDDFYLFQNFLVLHNK